MKAISPYAPIRRLYDEVNMPGNIRRSLNFIVLGNILGTIHGTICGGGTTAMIGLATEMGANDLIFGILSSIPQVAALMQLPFSVLVNRTHKRKQYMLTMGIFSRALWLFFGLIPYIIPMAPAMVQLWSIIFLLGISSVFGSIINVCWFPWLSDLTPLQIRGRWLSIRESILAGANVMIGLVVAFVLDTLPIETRYVIIFLIGGIAGIMDMVAFAFADDIYSAPPQKEGLFKAFGQVLKNKPFITLTVMWTAWCFTANLSGVFMTPYSMNEMGLSFMQIMIFSTIASALVTIIVMPKWGNMIDHFGCRNVMMISCIVASLTPLFYLLARPGSIWPTLLHNAIGALFWSGANLTCSNMQLISSPNESRPTHLAVFSCVTALGGGMLGSLAGGAMLESMNSAGLFTGFLDRYQALFILSVILRLGFVLLFVPRLTQDSEHRPSELVRYIWNTITFKRQ